MPVTRDHVRLLAGVAIAVSLPMISSGAAASTAASIAHATLGESRAATLEVSTAELRRLLAERGIVLLDTRPHMEWAAGHIPGALNVASKPGVPASLYTSDVAHVARLVGNDKTRALVLYCNGPYCGKSKRVSDELLEAGFLSVRRYQLGAPVWRALGGLMVIEPDGARRVFSNDRTAVWIDARDPEEFRGDTVPGAKNVPRSRLLPGKDVGEVKAAKDDGRLPMEDHNTRVIVFGKTGEQARALADAIAAEAFHNVLYFDGTAEALRAALIGR